MAKTKAKTRSSRAPGGGKSRWEIVPLRLDENTTQLIRLIAKVAGENEQAVMRVLITLGMLRHLAQSAGMQGKKKPPRGG